MNALALAHMNGAYASGLVANARLLVLVADDSFQKRGSR